MVDDSNEHMLSVWDCGRGSKLAEIKVRGPGGLQGPADGKVAGLGAENPDLAMHFLPFWLGHLGPASQPPWGQPPSLPEAVEWGLQEFWPHRR